MDISRYQVLAERTALYDNSVYHAYLIPGLVAEAGEVAGKYAKYIRDVYPTSEAPFDDKEWGEAVEGMKKELGDCLWFIARLCSEFGVDMGDVAQANIDKLQNRAAKSTIRGSGDDR